MWVQVPDAKIKYQQLLFLAKKLSPMPAAEHTEDNKVKGCVSQVIAVNLPSQYILERYHV